MSNRNPTALPYAVACLGIAIFSVMDAVMKGLSIALGAYNAMLWRLMAGAMLGGLIFLITRTPLPSRVGLRLHLMRGVIAAMMATLFFWGLARVPLAEAIALSFIAPLITLYLAAVMLGEKISRAAIIASLLGLAGVLVILSGRVGGSYTTDLWWGIGAVLLSAVLYAYNLILQRQQAQVASPVEIAFFQNLVAMSTLALAAPFWGAVPPSSAALPLIASAGFAIASLILLSWAYARAEAQILVSVEYTAFIWASILGWVVFHERVTPATLIGAALIVTGCIIAARQKPEHLEVVAL
jgi:S-adenosylmethionine uptake transporter